MEEYKINKNSEISGIILLITQLIEVNSIPNFGNLSNPKINIIMNSENYEKFKKLNNNFKIIIDDAEENILINLSSQFKYIKSESIENAVETKFLKNPEIKTIKIKIE